MVLSKYLRLTGSEYLLSLYPSLVHHLKVPLEIQMWGRFVVFTILGLFFGTGNFWKNLLDYRVIILSLINAVHIFSSYQGFKYLPPADAYSIFYMYPFINLILLKIGTGYHITGHQWFFFATALFGVFLLRANRFYMLMMGISAFTESIIYFMIKMIKPENSWDGVLYSYLWTAVALTFKNYMNYDQLSIPLLVNGAIGATGYYLRFWNVNSVEPKLYSLFSFLGIPFSYINQYLINGIKPKHLGGAIIILISLVLSVL
jgi:drug/metabolite transporter (DMT)-like permease